MRTGTSGQEVADYLRWLAVRDDPEEPVYLTNLQIQKLLYYVQGWALAERDQRLFEDELEAWREGPVVQSVWKHFQQFGKRPILEDAADKPDLLPEDEELVRAVWETYRRYSAPALRDMTHEDEPWKNARRGLAPSDRSNRPLAEDDLRRCFRTKVSAAVDRLASRRRRLAERSARNLDRLGRAVNARLDGPEADPPGPPDPPG